MVFPHGYHCEKCGEKYFNIEDKCCKQCFVNDYLKNNTSGNEIIDNLIQEIQLKIDAKIFECIPYNQFINIKKIEKTDFYKLYSAIWKDGPLIYKNKYYYRKQNEIVTLRCLNCSQNITNKSLNEV
jgi:hypothetical protein